MENLNTMLKSPSEVTASLGSLISSGIGARPGSSSSEDAQLFETVLSLIQSIVGQMSAAGGAHSASSGLPSSAGAGGGAPAGTAQPDAQTAPANSFSGTVGNISDATSSTAAAGGADLAPPGPPSNPGVGSGTPVSAAPSDGPAAPAGSPPAAGDASNGTSPGAPPTSAGSGPNSTTITNTSNHDEKIGQFLNGGSTTTPTAEIDLKPEQSGTLNYQNGQGGFDEEADSLGKYQSGASRLEFYADQNGKNNDDVSYIDKRNASISVSDGQGRTAGDTQSIAANAPAGTVTKDAAGNPTIQGWYDGSTGAMQSGGAYMQSKLGTGGAYIHPNDDQNKGANPMTMAGDTSQHYTAKFGNA